jgi:hypothetical protein
MNQTKQIDELLTAEVGISYLRGLVDQIRSYNGMFDDLVCYENDRDFFETFFYNNPFEVAMSISFGNYRYNDELVRFDAYGNLKTLSDYEYEEELFDSKEDILTELIDVWNEIKEYLPFESYVAGALDNIINGGE